jgi:hypothetical protein
MTVMRFYRGIALPTSKVDRTISTTTNYGLAEGQGRWGVERYHPGSLDVLFAKADLSLQDTRAERRQGQPAVCACGEEMGAAHYAWRHNRTREDDAPVMIEFDADHESVAIDGRDFLYPVLQMGKPGRARAILVRSFGSRILRYAEKAWDSNDHELRTPRVR